MKKILLFVAISCLMFSWKIQGLTNDYDKLNETQKKILVDLVDFKDLKSENIYKITGNQLKQELANHPKSLVYIFKNGCSSKLCKPMRVYENYANDNGYKLFLVMNGYANLQETLDQPYSSILFSINNDFYNSNYRNTYMQYFENEISEKPKKEKSKEYLGNLFFFEKDKLVQILHELPNN
jgi:hypothetical protein